MQFLVLEGTDYSGKTTQIQMLAKHFEALGKKVITVREPGGTMAGEKIRTILKDKAIPMDPVAQLLLFQASRCQLMGEIVRPALDAGHVVLCDRFYPSTLAYQGILGKVPLEYILNTSVMAIGDTVPSHIFFLETSTDTFLQRKERDKGVTTDRYDPTSAKAFQAIKDAYGITLDRLQGTKLAGMTKLCTISADGSPIQTFKAILAQINTKT